MPQTYTKALAKQFRNETIGLLHKLLGKPTETLQEKLKDSNSIESKLLATMMVIVASTQWLEGLIAKAAAELSYIEGLIEKDHRIAAHGGPATYSREEEREEQENRLNQQPVTLTALTLRLDAVKTELNSLKEQQNQLNEQYEEARTQFKEIHDQELRGSFAEFGMTANQEQVEQLRELVNHKVDDKLLNKVVMDSYEKYEKMVMNSYELALEKSKSLGLPPPPPPPLPTTVVNRVVQVSSFGVDAAFVAVLMAVHKNDPTVNNNVRTALNIFPLIKAVIEDQEHALEKLAQYFEEHKEQIDKKITNLQGEETTLRNEINRFINPGAIPSMMNGPSLGNEPSVDKEEDEKSNQPSSFRR